MTTVNFKCPKKTQYKDTVLPLYGPILQWEGSRIMQFRDPVIIIMWIRVLLNMVFTRKRKCFQFCEISITGCTGSCQNDNFQCSQWLKFRHIDNFSISVYILEHGVVINMPERSSIHERVMCVWYNYLLRTLYSLVFGTRDSRWIGVFRWGLYPAYACLWSK